MKHILNNIDQFEKQRILEQHSGGMVVDNKKFLKLLESKLGNVKPLLNEQVEPNAGSIQQFLKDNLPDPNLKVDFAFGNGTAAAAAKYIAKSYGTTGYDDVTTVKRLWEVMKSYKYDVGETPGFGPKMATALAQVLNQGKTKLDQAAAKPAAAKPAAAKPVVQSKPVVYGRVTVDLGKRTLTLNDKIDFERSGGGSELRLGKGVTFTKKSNGTLVTSNQNAQLVSDLVGQVEEELKGVTITYYCKTKNLDIAGRSVLFYNEDYAPVSGKAFDALCNLK